MVLRYGTPEEAGMSSSRISKVEALQQEWIDKDVTPIMVSLVARRGIIVSHKLFVEPGYNKTYGPMNIDTIFQLASISKTLTTTAIMLLAEEGKVGINMPVQEYIPEFDGKNKDQVLLFHLMTHTSAIDEGKIWEISNSPEFSVDMTLCPSNLHPDIYRYLNAGYKAPLRTYPGTEMSYCGYGICLLAEVIRRVTGQNLHEFCEERIFKPLDMKSSYFIMPDEQMHRVAKHPPNAPFPNFADRENLIKPWGSTGLCSTAYDMAVFSQMFLNGGTYGGKRYLSRLAVDKMTTNQIPGVSSRYGDEFFKEACWGLAWNVSGYKNDYTGTLRSEKTYSNSGRGNTLIMVDPENEIQIINFQVTMKRINNRPYHYFECFSDAVLACIED